MKSLKFLFYTTFVLILTACPEKSGTIDPSKKLDQSKNQASSKKQAEVEYSKEFRESLYFAASLEREALRLITKNSSFESTTLFSLMSYAFEADSGIKKSAPTRVDCTRFKILKKETEITLSKICIKPETLIARTIEKNQGRDYEIQFFTKEFGSVVGLSVALTNPDIICQLVLKEKKLQFLNCQNWTYQMSSNDLSSTEVKLKTFLFDRNQQKQLHLVGGFYKDLIENKKIEVIVPLEGKIKLIEKEIEVKDDFIDKPKTNEVPHGKKENDEKENRQKENPTEKENKPQEGQVEDDYQKWIKQDQNSGQSQNTDQKNADQEVEKGRQENNQPEIEQDQNNGGVPKIEERRGR